MAVIIPAILPSSRADLEEKLTQLMGITEEVQVDIVDGFFAEPPTWPYASGGEVFAAKPELPFTEDFRMEVDLMVRDAEQITGTWIEAGATRILAHVESTTYLPQLVTDLKRKFGHEKGLSDAYLSFGLALNTSSDLALIEPYIDEVDYVQFMGIHEIGKQGQPFAEEVIEKIMSFRRAHQDIPVQVDGGVNLESAVKLLEAGVSRLVVGSALWNAPDLSAEYQKFKELTELHGIFT